MSDENIDMFDPPIPLGEEIVGRNEGSPESPPGNPVLKDGEPLLLTLEMGECIMVRLDDGIED